ncbi:MAG: lasso peptide isopeptide bond-forming cyclase [Proteobacteria bacterium]|nr:lasso peptide isopeptide bond-forming cyclase [Pseudomonadota bacterium]
MSAIIGIYYPDGRPVAENHLKQMVEILAHRGPDGAGVWNRGSVGMGHRMLWTTPESLQEKAPLTNSTGDIIITADARIDNRGELIETLELTDRPSGEITDSQLILDAYEKWGERCPEKLIGDFAFAIWDARRQRFFCVRDPMGVKSLYYYHSRQFFVFASEIKALFCLPEVPRNLNEVKVADHLATIFEDRASTYYRGIFRLPPAHLMLVNSDKIQLRSYWSLDPSHNIRLSSDEEYAEAFRELFTEAVRCRIRSAFPIGSTLSGGLDSSSIACTARNLMAQHGDGSLHTFSAIFPSLPEEDLRKIDERRYISAVLATGGFVPHYVHADRLGPLAELERVMRYADEAVLAPNMYMHRALYRAAQDHGIRAFLDGIDGDTTVSHGLEYLPELARTGRWGTLITEATALAANSRGSRRKIIWRFGLRPLVPEFVIKAWRKLHGHNDSRPACNTAIVNPAFARRIGLTERIEKQQAQSASLRTAREIHLYGLTQGLNAHGLQELDRAAASFLLEPRYPFFDRRLMEFCLALPPEQKLHMGWPRIILRRAMAGILPQEVQWRFTKSNLSPNFTRRLLDYERRTLEDVIFNNSNIIEHYVDMPTLRDVYHRYSANPMHRTQDALTVYSVVTLALWLRRSGISN